MNRKQRRAQKSTPPAPSQIVRPAYQRIFEDALWLHQSGQLDKAESLYRQVLEMEPRHFECLHRLGMIACQKGDHFKAIDLISRAIALNDKVALYFSNLGVSQDRGGLPDAAIASYRRAVELQPQYVLALNNLGVLLHAQGLLGDAADCYRRILAVQPNDIAALNNLGNLLKDLGQAARAVACYRRALDSDPTFTEAASNIAVAVTLIAEWSADEAFAATKQAGACFDSLFGARQTQSHGNQRDPERRLRIGYLSPSLQNHVLAGNIEPLLRAHRRDRVAVHVYADVPHPDEVTRRLQGLADSWTFVHATPDAEVARRIMADGIDILINPIGHWAHNRLSVFALKPTPIQVSYLIQGLSSGMQSLDYAIGDPWINFDGAMQNYATENVVELPSGFQVTSFAKEWVIGDVPMMANGFVTFASFNNPTKLSDTTLELWAAVMARVPNSRLLIKGLMLDRAYSQGVLRQRLVALGIAPERVEMVGFLTADEHMELHNRVDIILDTTPFSGGRTTEDALWMGVPVVTLIGDTICGRISYSHLGRIGAPELAVHSKAEYVELAVGLAETPDRLRHYRKTLRKSFATSSLLDADTHVTELEDAFRDMWRQWCDSPKVG